MWLISRHFHATKNEDAVKRYTEQSNYYLGVVNGHLKNSKSGFILDKGFTGVDAHMYAWLNIAPFAKLNLADFPAVDAYVKKIKEMPETKRAYEKIPAGTDV